MQVHYFTRANGRSPVREFISSFNTRIQSKIIHVVDLIQRYDIASASNYTRKLVGTPLWEIRIVGKTSVRLLYAIQDKDVVVILHGFVKKTQKTPLRELRKALHVLDEYRKLRLD